MEGQSGPGSLGTMGLCLPLVPRSSMRFSQQLSDLLISISQVRRLRHRSPLPKVILLEVAELGFEGRPYLGPEPGSVTTTFIYNYSVAVKDSRGPPLVWVRQP